MVLEHVADGAGALIVLSAFPDAFVFVDGHVYFPDIAVVPDGIEDRVREAQGEEVADHVLREVVVEAVDLGFVEVAGDERVQAFRRCGVEAERFLEREAGRFRRKAVRRESFDDVSDESVLRWDCKIEEERFFRYAAQGVGEDFHALSVVVAGNVSETGNERLDIAPFRARTFGGHRIGNELSELLVGEIRPSAAGHMYAFVAQEEIEKRRIELFLREVARGAEEHEFLVDMERGRAGHRKECRITNGE